MFMEGREVSCNSIPQNRVADSEIFVHDEISHGTHVRPGDARILGAHLVWDVGGRLPNDSQIANYGIHGAPVGDKILKIHPSDISADGF